MGSISNQCAIFPNVSNVCIRDLSSVCVPFNTNNVSIRPVSAAPVANAAQSVEQIINNLIPQNIIENNAPYFGPYSAEHYGFNVSGQANMPKSFTCPLNQAFADETFETGQSTLADKPYFDVVKDTINDVAAQSFEMVKNGVNSSVEVIQSATEKVSEFAVENKEYIFGAAAFTGVALMAKGAYDLYKNPFARVKAGTEMLSGFALATSAAVGFFFSMETE